MHRVAAIVVLDNLDDRDSLLEWAEDRELPLAFCADQLFVAEVADSLPVNPAQVLQIHFVEPSRG
jgi:hypothetical protein